jgi:hypothetical protein
MAEPENTQHNVDNELSIEELEDVAGGTEDAAENGNCPCTTNYCLSQADP